MSDRPRGGSLDLGVYNLKYPVRRLIAGVLPAFRDVDPNTVSWAMLPVGVLIALCYYLAPQGRPALYLVGILLIFGRMLVGTLDGLLATHYGRITPAGTIVNRVAPELCDAMYMLALCLARPEWRVPAIAALTVSWLISFAGLIGAAAGRPVQTVGPVGQPDRLVALQGASLLAFLAPRLARDVDFIALFLWWTAAGGALTVWVRLRRHLRAAAVPANGVPDATAPASHQGDPS